MAKAKADLSEFYRLARPKRPPCRIGFILTQLPEEESAQLQAACEQDKGIINTGAIRQWLAARRHDVSIAAITNHRSATCTCGTDDE